MSACNFSVELKRDATEVGCQHYQTYVFDSALQQTSNKQTTFRVSRSCQHCCSNQEDRAEGRKDPNEKIEMEMRHKQKIEMHLAATDGIMELVYGCM